MMEDIFAKLYDMTAFSNIIADPSFLIMYAIAFILLYLGIRKHYEPLLLVPIAFGVLIANFPGGDMGVIQADENGMVMVNGVLKNIWEMPLHEIAHDLGLMNFIYYMLIKTGFLPPVIFMGVGALTDFGPMLRNLRLSIFGAAAQLGIFTVLLCAVMMGFTPQEAGALGIIGGADGPTSLFLCSKLGQTAIMGPIAVAAYSYMALVPVIQPPIMKLCTTEAERKIVMKQLRPVSKREKILFPIVLLLLCAFLLPDAAPLIGALTFGNLIKESGVAERLSKTLQNDFCNIVTILLGLSVGSKLQASQFLRTETLGILLLGVIAFSIATAAGVLMARLMNLFVKDKINPLIGSAGVSAVPMAARVSNKLGLEYDKNNYLLMHAMGPNVSGVIGSAVAAGVLLALLK